VGACGISDPGSGRAVRRLEVRSGEHFGGAPGLPPLDIAYSGVHLTHR